MSQVTFELRALAEAAYRALNAGDLDGFLALMTEDIEFTSMIAEAEGTTFQRRDRVRAWWETVVASFQDVRWELLDIQGSDDRAVIHVRVAGTLGGVPVEITMRQAACQGPPGIPTGGQITPHPANETSSRASGRTERPVGARSSAAWRRDRGGGGPRWAVFGGAGRKAGRCEPM